MSWAERLEKIISEKPSQAEVSKVSKATKPTFRHFRHSGAGGISQNKFSSFSEGGCVPETYGVPLAELQKLAGDDWPELQNDLGQLEFFAHAIQTRRMRESGRRPAHYTQRSECTSCGLVWLWKGAPRHVLSCPWCFNRHAGVTVPRPNEIER